MSAVTYCPLWLLFVGKTWRPLPTMHVSIYRAFSRSWRSLSTLIMMLSVGVIELIYSSIMIITIIIIIINIITTLNISHHNYHNHPNFLYPLASSALNELWHTNISTHMVSDKKELYHFISHNNGCNWLCSTSTVLCYVSQVGMVDECGKWFQTHVIENSNYNLTHPVVRAMFNTSMWCDYVDQCWWMEK